MKRGKKIKDVSLLEVTHSCVSYKSLQITFILYPYRNKLSYEKRQIISRFCVFSNKCWTPFQILMKIK